MLFCIEALLQAPHLGGGELSFSVVKYPPYETISVIILNTEDSSFSHPVLELLGVS